MTLLVGSFVKTAFNRQHIGCEDLRQYVKFDIKFYCATPLMSRLLVGSPDIAEKVNIGRYPAIQSGQDPCIVHMASFLKGTGVRVHPLLEWGYRTSQIL